MSRKSWNKCPDRGSLTTFPTLSCCPLFRSHSNYINNNPECKLIVIDTLLLITPPMNDSPYANDYNNIVALKQFADKHELAVVIIHHTRKLKAKDPFDEILGTSGLNGAADTMMILSREGRSGCKGMLKYTGRDLSDEEIGLEFNDGDWRLADEEEMPGAPSFFVQIVLDCLGDETQWAGTATVFSEATGGEIANRWVIRNLEKHRNELEQYGISFTNDRSSSERAIRIYKQDVNIT